MFKKRVLVVDDSALLREILTDALKERGFQVATAPDGSEALRLVCERRPDLIIADILMPVMDGWALCEEVRRNKTTCDIPIVFLTTERDVPKRIKGLEMGADDYVCKPFSKEELLARVDSVLRRVSASRRSRRKKKSTHPDEFSLTGNSSHITIPDVLQMLSMNHNTGTLHLRGRSVANIFYKEGQIINAEVQGLKGQKALFRIMAWPDVRYEFEPKLPDRDVETALDASTSSVLMEGFAQLDELRDLTASLPEEHHRLRQVKEAIDEAGDLSITHRLILLAVSGGATMSEVVDTVPDNDLVAYTLINDLLKRGLLEVDEPQQAL